VGELLCIWGKEGGTIFIWGEYLVAIQTPAEQLAVSVESMCRAVIYDFR